MFYIPVTPFHYCSVIISYVFYAVARFGYADNSACSSTVTMPTATAYCPSAATTDDPTTWHMPNNTAYGQQPIQVFALHIFIFISYIHVYMCTVSK